MIPYVNSRLVMWAEWVLKGQDSGLGYPKECPYTRLMARSGGGGYQPNFDSDSREVDEVLAKLKQEQPALYRTTHLFYGIDFKSGKAFSINLTSQQIAKTLECHRDTVYSNLDRAHRLILDGFLENDAIAHVR
jgi:hypothetical protein